MLFAGPETCVRREHGHPGHARDARRWIDEGAPMAASTLRSASVFPLFPLLLSLALVACTGDDGDQGPPGPPGDSGTPTDLEQGDSLPGLTPTILSLTGGTASGGHFRVGDTITVKFRLQKDDGSDWDIAELG